MANEFTSSNSLYVDTAVPLTYGTDATGLLGLSVFDDEGTELTLTECTFDYEINRMYLKTSSKIIPNKDYIMHYDAVVGSLVERAGWDKQERVSDANFENTGGWSCLGVGTCEQANGALSGTAYFYQYVPRASIQNSHYEVTLESDGTGVDSGFDFSFGQYGSVEYIRYCAPGESFSEIFIDKRTDFTGDPYLTVKVHDGAGTAQCLKVSMAELIPIQGSAIGSAKNIQLSNYLNGRKTHLMHFPFDETSGNIFTDIMSGLTITEPEGNATFETNGVRFGSASYTDPYGNNVLSSYGAGLILFYFSVTWDSSGTGTASKGGLSHTNINSCVPCDFQHNDGNANAQINITGDRQSKALSELLAPPLNPFDYTGGEFAGCIVVNFNKLGTDDLAFANKIYLTDGTTVNTGDLKTSDIITNFDLTNNAYKWKTYPKFNETIQQYEDASEIFVPAHRVSLTYCKGIYEFKDFEPTAGEIETFLNWLYAESRAGNKESYPAWVDKV